MHSLADDEEHKKVLAGFIISFFRNLFGGGHCFINFFQGVFEKSFENSYLKKSRFYYDDGKNQLGTKNKKSFIKYVCSVHDFTASK